MRRKRKKGVAFTLKIERSVKRGRVPHIPTRVHSSPKGGKGYSRSKEKGKLRRDYHD